MRSRRRSRSIAIVMLMVAGALPATLHGQWFRRAMNLLRPPPVATPQGADPDSDDDSDGPRSIVLFENGDVRRKLELVRLQIDGQHYEEAARKLGQFLQDAETRDFFLRHDDGRRDGQSFQAEVRRLLYDLPPAGQAAYRVQFEPVARARLNAAVARGGEASLREVAQRFPETRAGDEALYRLGYSLWDHGRIHAAAACFKRLKSRPLGAAPFEPALSAMIAACWTRLGCADRARAAIAPLRKSFQSVAVSIAGSLSPTLSTDQAVDEFLARFGRESFQAVDTAEDWQTFRGDAARNRSVAARAPFLAPRWSQPASTDAQTQLMIERARHSYAQGMATSLPLLNPLVVDDLVLTRTAHGVAAFDRLTGQALWRYPSADDGDNAGLDRILWQEPAGGSFSVDDECVYLLENLQMGDADAGRSSRNVLSALEHLQSRQGNLRWQVGGVGGGAEPRLANAFFLGPALCWQGRLYLLAEWKAALSLVVLDRANGHLEWSQDLALVEQGISEDPFRMIGGATPSIAPDEIIICPTSGGAVVAVDLTTQSLLWAYRYTRRAAGRGRGDLPAPFDENEHPPRLDQFDRWLDATVALAGGCAIVTPCESHEIHCLDLQSGQARWAQPRGESMFVACTAGERVIVVGRKQVQARQFADGAMAWSLALPQGSFPAGRGVFAGERYFLPTTTASILEIDLATGKIAGEQKSPREIPAGNLIWHKGLFISQGPSALEAFDEHEQLVGQIRDRLEKNPRDSEALIRRGELELASGNLAQAIAAFRMAHKAARSPKAKARLTSALLEGVRKKIPDFEQLTAELDLLMGP